MTARRVLAVALAAVGVVWIGQGLGYIGGSFMTSDLRWTFAGAVLIVVAVGLVSSGRFTSPTRSGELDARRGANRGPRGPRRPR